MTLLNIWVSEENKFQFCAVMLKAVFSDVLSTPVYRNIKFSGKKATSKTEGFPSTAVEGNLLPVYEQPSLDGTFSYKNNFENQECVYSVCIHIASFVLSQKKPQLVTGVPLSTEE